MQILRAIGAYSRQVLRAIHADFARDRLVDPGEEDEPMRFFWCVLLTASRPGNPEVGIFQVKRLKITKTQVRNRIHRYDFMKISSKIKRRSASIHII